MLTRSSPDYGHGVGRVRFVWPARRRVTGLGATRAASTLGGAVLCGIVFCGTVLCGTVLCAGQALAGTPAGGAPLAGSASATLTQVSAGEWTTTVYLDTTALCAGRNPAGNTFTLVTAKPDSVTGAAAPAYPGGPLACAAPEANPVTEVRLSFTPALTAIPQTATLAVTPPRAQLLAGDTPLQIPLTVRRIVSPWQYAGIPAICGAALAVLLVLLLMIIGMPGKDERHVVATAKRAPGPPGHYVLIPDRGRVGATLLVVLLLLVARRRATAQPPPPSAASLAGRPPKRVRMSLDFWRTPLFAGAAWSFGDSWATSVTPLTALAGGVLTASGAVAGLVPGVDLTRFGLLMALVGGLTTFAPLLFGALNSLFPERQAAEPAPAGEVIAASLWVMLLASCLTVFAIGAEIGFVGLVLGFNLIVVSPSIRWIGPVATGLAALLFLAYGAHSILTLAGQPFGTAKKTAKKSSFMI